MSRRRQHYRKHVVEATSIPLREGGFTVHVDIELHEGSHIDVSHFETGHRFETDEGALSSGLKFGREKLDAGYDVGTPVTS